MCGSFYYLFFPFLIGKIGALRAVPSLFCMQFLVSVVCWFMYDYIGKDIIGLSSIKMRLEEQGRKVRKRFPRWGRFLDRYRKVARALEFAFFSWQFIPPLALLCLRKEGKKGDTTTEIGMLCGSSAFATVIWTGYSVGLFEPIVVFIKSNF